MLLSMTGQGQARVERDGIVVSIELRTINSRYFKLNFRGSEGCMGLEPQIEAVIRKQIRRGTVQVGLRVDHRHSSDEYQLNAEVLAAYRRQLEALNEKLHVAATVPLEALLNLPGVVGEAVRDFSAAEKDWPVVQQTLVQALENLDHMRRDEGRAMADDLAANCQDIRDALEAIGQLAPAVGASYRNRLQERMNLLLADYDVRIEAGDIAREVAVFSERCDISEEVVRLKSHLEQFAAIMSAPESSGRKLEFLTQEMFRETNTIGSKANDADIAGHVIGIKAAIERMREMIQNVE